MSESGLYLVMAAAALAAVAILAAAGLAGWRGWLQLKHRELASQGDWRGGQGAGARIEIADLKERIRKLEAIAAGVEL